MNRSSPVDRHRGEEVEGRDVRRRKNRKRGSGSEQRREKGRGDKELVADRQPVDRYKAERHYAVPSVNCDIRPIAHWRRFKIRRQKSAPGDSAGRATGGGGGGFFLACEDLGRMFDNSFPVCAFF